MDNINKSPHVSLLKDHHQHHFWLQTIPYLAGEMNSVVTESDLRLVNRNIYPLPIFTVWHIGVTRMQHPLFFRQLTLKLSHFEHDCVNLSATLVHIWALKMSGYSLVSLEMLEPWTTLLNKNAMKKSLRALCWSLRYTYSISCWSDLCK